MSKSAVDTQTQSTTVTGGNTNFVPTSGAIGTSATSALAGPWYIETQTLQIDYVRVPKESSWANSCEATLSGLTTTHAPLVNTSLLAHFTASYEAVVSYQTFSTSSVQQPQEFKIIAASGDPNGMSYGNLTASTLGPMGTIITSKPYVRRVPYTSATSSTQPILSKVVNGANFGMVSSTCDGGTAYLTDGGGGLSAMVLDSDSYFGDLNFWAQNNSNNEIIGNASERRAKGVKAMHWYQIPASYSTQKELMPLETLIDYFCTFITNEKMMAYPTANRNATFPTHLATDTGLPEYDSNRHA